MIQKIIIRETFRKAIKDNEVITFCDSDPSDTELHGYLFILQNLISPERLIEFITAARKLTFLHNRVLSDIEDFLITDSLRSIGSDYLKDKTKAGLKMKFLSEKSNDEKNRALRAMQPPNVWNYVEVDNLEKKRLVFQIIFDTNKFFCDII